VKPCLNCATPLGGRYCAACGQRDSDLKVSFWHLVREALGEAFEIDSRLMRTIRPFFLKPGFLAREYVDGRRTRYSSPFRIYIFCSFAFFVGGYLQASFIKDADWHVKSDFKFSQKERDELQKEGRVGAVMVRTSENLQRLAASDRELQRRLSETIIGYVPKGVFVLLPVFALILKLLYRKTDAFYVDHLILALHLHAFGFLMLIPLGNLKRFSDLTILVLLVYVAVALKTFYRQSWARTIAKLMLLSVLYLIPLLSAMGALFFAAIVLA
jgi:hypothetical protein